MVGGAFVGGSVGGEVGGRVAGVWGSVGSTGGKVTSGCQASSRSVKETGNGIHILLEDFIVAFV